MPSFTDQYRDVDWRLIKDPRFRTICVEFEYSLLGFDMKSRRVDMMMRYGPLGQSRPHRHLAHTSTFVLAGEHHTVECQPGAPTRTLVHPPGAYHVSQPDDAMHINHAGSDGCTVLMVMTSPSGNLFEFFDDDLRNGRTVTMQAFVSEWMRQKIFGPTELPTSGVETYRLKAYARQAGEANAANDDSR